MSTIREELISRIIDPFEKQIYCESGWDGLLYDLHDKVVAVDPNYTLAQVKEKFGTLRFYYNASNPEQHEIIRTLVRFYEKLSGSVCEKTGARGSLMFKGGLYKTLSDEYLDQGWEKVERHTTLPQV